MSEPIEMRLPPSLRKMSYADIGKMVCEQSSDEELKELSAKLHNSKRLQEAGRLQRRVNELMGFVYQ